MSFKILFSSGVVSSTYEYLPSEADFFSILCIRAALRKEKEGRWLLVLV